MTWAQAFRDIFIAAINRGQLLTAILGLFLIVVVWRLPQEDLSGFVRMVIESLISGHLLGYVLFVLTLTGWFVNSRRLRTIASKEQKRIGDEKTELQKATGLGKKVRSSGRR